MADTKISALPASTTPLAGTEVLPIVQSSVTKQVSVANLTAGRAVATGALTVTGAATVSTTLGVTGVATLGNGAILGIPASGTVTNLTGTASININGTVGATTANTGAFTTLSATGQVTASGATNGFVTDATNGYALFSGDPANYNISRNSLDIQIKSASTIGALISGTRILSVSSTGLAVTGTLSATTTGQVGTTLGVGGATPSASGSGITFPATQSASSNANTLDDYEEGTWTPALAGTSAVTYSNQEGRYTKVGRLVTITMLIQPASVTYVSSTAQLKITGLPFTPVAMSYDSANSWGAVAASGLAYSGSGNDQSATATSAVAYVTSTPELKVVAVGQGTRGVVNNSAFPGSSVFETTITYFV